MKSDKYQYGLVGICCVAVLLRLLQLGARDFWYDELFALRFARWPWSHWNAPLYYIVLHYWTRLFGVSEWILRMPSAIFSSVSVGLCYMLGKEFFNKKIAVIAALLIGLSPFQLWYAQEAREYAMMLCCSLVAAIAFFRALQSGGLVYWVLFAWASLAGLYIHYVYIFFVITQAIYLVCKKKASITFRESAVFFIIALGFSFYLSRFMDKLLYVKDGFWIPEPQWQSVGITLANFIVGYNAMPVLYAGGFLAIGVLSTCGLTAAYKQGATKEKFLDCHFFLWVPIAMVFLFSRLWFSVYLDRGLIIYSPYLYLILAFGIGTFKAKRIRTIAGFVLLAVMGIANYLFFTDQMVMPLMYHTGVYIKKPIRPVVKVLEHYVSSRDIIGATNHSFLPQVDFYGKRIFGRLYYFFDPQIFGTDWNRPIQETKYCVPFYKASGLTFERLWILAGDWSRSGALDENSEKVKEWLDANLTLEYAEEFDGVWVFRYARTP